MSQPPAPLPKRPGSRQSLPRGTASREAILAAALRVVGRRGLSGASLGLIAKEAGTSKPAVLYHYGSRDNLLHQMASRALAQLQALVLDIAREAERPERTQIALDVTFAKENRLMLCAARELMSLGIHDGVVADLVRRSFDEVERTIAMLLPESIDNRLQIASDLVRAVYGFIELWLVSGDEDPGPYQAGALRVSLRLAASARAL